MAENLMNPSHIAASPSYRANYDRIFKKVDKVIEGCPFLCDYGEEDLWYCQAVQRYVRECHPACRELPPIKE